MSFLFKILNILTFGHFSRKVKKQIKKLSNEKNTSLIVNTSKLPNIEIIVKSLGTKSNILNISNTISTISFEVKDKNVIDIAMLKKISKKGIIISNNKIILTIGDCAKKIKEEIIKQK